MNGSSCFVAGFGVEEKERKNSGNEVARVRDRKGVKKETEDRANSDERKAKQRAASQWKIRPNLQVLTVLSCSQTKERKK